MDTPRTVRSHRSLATGSSPITTGPSTALSAGILRRLATPGRLAPGLAFALALLAGGCGEDEPIVRPDVDPLAKGWIAGRAFVSGDPERTTFILIEIFIAGTREKVSTTFPGEDGRFLSDSLVAGDYDLTATLDFPGYFPARVENISVSPSRVTELAEQVTVPDTSSVLFERLTPIPQSLLIDRRPVVSGEFRSAGSGFKIDTLVLTIDGRRITMGLEVEEIVPLRHGRFSYQPGANLSPGVVVANVLIHNRAGRQFQHPWTFRVLEGISRRVPADYPTIAEAVGAANDGDTVLVAPGVHDALNVLVRKDLIIMGERGREVTTIRSSGNRHFEVLGDETRHVIIQDLTLTAGHTDAERPGGSILCRDATLTVERCNFFDNGSADRGGALALFDTPAVVKDCLFARNQAYRGGAIAIFDLATPEISGCVFNLNSVTGSLGGAILVEYSAPRIHHNTFVRNDAGNGHGGAIMADFRLGPADLFTESNIFFENRSDPSDGSAISLNGSNLTSICDGFLRNDGLPVSGTGTSPDLRRLLDLPSNAEPGFCDLAAEDFRVLADSEFLSDGCERGAFPPGCKP